MSSISIAWLQCNQNNIGKMIDPSLSDNRGG